MAAHLLAGTAMNLVEHWTTQLRIIAEHLIGTGQDGYASQLASIAHFIDLQERTLLGQQDVTRMLADRLAKLPPPPKQYPGPVMMPRERIKGDM